MDVDTNAAETKTRTVTVTLDATIPVITRLGNAEVTIEAGSTYTDAGATGFDSFDGQIDVFIMTSYTFDADGAGPNPAVPALSVDTSIPGVYTVVYDLDEDAGNSATQVTRKVTVEDTTAPLITLVTPNPFVVQVGSAFIDPGFMAMDIVDDNAALTLLVVVDVSAIPVDIPGDTNTGLVTLKIAFSGKVKKIA